MEIELQFKDVMDPQFKNALEKIDNSVGVLTAKDMYEWNRLKPELDKELRSFNQARHALLDKYALKDKDGKPKLVKKPNGLVPELGENEEKCESEFQDLLEQKFTIKSRGLDADTLDKLGTVLSAKEIRICDKIKRQQPILKGVTDERGTDGKETMGE